MYEESLVIELRSRGLKVERQLSYRVKYKGNELEASIRIDLLVEDKVIVECKATSQYNSIFEAQALTYCRVTGKKLALVINFGERVVKDGIHRVVNGL
ncbi:GxxExxY protein [Candidatus Sumerlaeota bacterium]|nr:GxxExxY protein [Candidatus Sumerlaeota bacterium]